MSATWLAPSPTVACKQNVCIAVNRCFGPCSGRHLDLLRFVQSLCVDASGSFTGTYGALLAKEHFLFKSQSTCSVLETRLPGSSFQLSKNRKNIFTKTNRQTLGSSSKGPRENVGTIIFQLCTTYNYAYTNTAYVLTKKLHYGSLARKKMVLERKNSLWNFV